MQAATLVSRRAPTTTASWTGRVLTGLAVAFMAFGALLITGVLTLGDIGKQGDTLVTFLWLAVLFALSAQLNELGFMGYVGERLALRLDGLS